VVKTQIWFKCLDCNHEFYADYELREDYSDVIDEVKLYGCPMCGSKRVVTLGENEWCGCVETVIVYTVVLYGGIGFHRVPNVVRLT